MCVAQPIHKETDRLEKAKTDDSHCHPLLSARPTRATNPFVALKETHSSSLPAVISTTRRRLDRL
jgi:hypothetical protein